jgi:hypothetical protein
MSVFGDGVLVIQWYKGIYSRAQKSMGELFAEKDVCSGGRSSCCCEYESDVFVRNQILKPNHNFANVGTVSDVLSSVLPLDSQKWLSSGR